MEIEIETVKLESSTIDWTCKKMESFFPHLNLSDFKILLLPDQGVGYCF